MLERVEWLVLLETPELDGPIKRRAEEQMRKVYASRDRVSVDSRYRTLVALVSVSDSCPRTMPTSFIERKNSIIPYCS